MPLQYFLSDIDFEDKSNGEVDAPANGAVDAISVETTEKAMEDTRASGTREEEEEHEFEP